GASSRRRASCSSGLKQQWSSEGAEPSLIILSTSVAEKFSGGCPQPNVPSRVEGPNLVSKVFSKHRPKRAAASSAGSPDAPPNPKAFQASACPPTKNAWFSSPPRLPVH